MSKTVSEITTIAAIATPPGKGGIGIIRVSGCAVPQIIQSFFGHSLEPRNAALLPFKNETGEMLDKGIAIFFEAPHSYTGEHVLELQAHGGPLLLNLLLKRILKLGASLAKPGEFTERAFLNGKMNLNQAEAVIDLIESSSEQATLAAARSLNGALSDTVNGLLQSLIYLRTYIEAALDFPEEEIDFLSDQKLQTNMQATQQQFKSVLQTLKAGSLLREGMSVVILGQPNVGKSSLLNRLAGRNTAIVTDIAGTTRDVLREHIHIDGMPLHIIDTAGLRETSNSIEQEGVKRAWSEVEQADRVILMVDDRKGLTHTEDKIRNQLPSNRPVDIIYNKIDESQRRPFINQEATSVEIGLSAKTGQGISILLEHLKASMGFEQTAENVMTARQRHIDALLQVQQHLNMAQTHLDKGVGELAAEELRLGQQSLSFITGEFTNEDLLGEIFSSFCIGK